MSRAPARLLVSPVPKATGERMCLSAVTSLGHDLRSPSALGAGHSGQGKALPALPCGRSLPWPRVTLSVSGRPVGLHRRAVPLLRADLNTGRSHCHEPLASFPAFPGVEAPQPSPHPQKRHILPPQKPRVQPASSSSAGTGRGACVYRWRSAPPAPHTELAQQRRPLPGRLQGGLALSCRCVAGLRVNLILKKSRCATGVGWGEGLPAVGLEEGRALPLLVLERLRPPSAAQFPQSQAHGSKDTSELLQDSSSTQLRLCATTYARNVRARMLQYF